MIEGDPRGNRRVALARVWRVAQVVLGLVVGAAILWLALRNIAWDDLWGALRSARWEWVGVACVTNLLYTLARAWRWQVLLHSTSERLSFAPALAIASVGQLVNAFLPTRVGEIARGYVAGRGAAAGSAAVLGTIVVEKLLDAILLALTLAALGTALHLPAWLRSAGLTFLWSLVVLCLLVGLTSFGRHWLLRLADRLSGRLRRLALGGIAGLSVLRSGSTLSAGLIITSLTWVLAASTNWFLFMAFGLPPSAATALVILVAVFLGSLIRIVPGQLGVFHYATILALAAFGVGQEAAIPYVLVLHLLVYATIIILGVASLWWLGLGWRQVLGGSDLVRALAAEEQ